MRLICPNCGAQYEVPVDVIPEAGRDVQCSSCGTTWFQAHPDSDADLAEDLDQPLDEGSDVDLMAADDLTDDVTEDEDDWQEEWSRDAPNQVVMPDADERDEDDLYDEDYEEQVTAPVAEASAMRRQLDPGVADLLREEAEREARARAAERKPEPLESQPELGLSEPEDEASRRMREARDRMARMRGEAAEAAAPAAAMSQGAPGTGSRRDLLPDIDEINSTLRSTSDRRPQEADDHMTPGEDATPRGTSTPKAGFRRGFFFALLIAAVLACLYVYANDLGQAVPALKAPLQSYVALIDSLRLWLDGRMKALLVWLDGMATEKTAS